jgi:rod shape-determining protein MreC
VMLAGSRGHALLVGANQDRPRLAYWEAGSAPKEGEQVVTSAEAGAYPAGLPVGVVHYTGPGQAEVVPDADLARLELVRVVDYGTVAVPPPEATQAAAPKAAKP